MNRGRARASAQWVAQSLRLDPLLNFEILRAASRSHLVKYPRRWKVGQDKETRPYKARDETGPGQGRNVAPVKARRREIESHRVIFQSTPKTLATLQARLRA